MILITHQSLLGAGQAGAIWAWVGASGELAPGAPIAGKALFPHHTRRASAGGVVGQVGLVLGLGFR